MNTSNKRRGVGEFLYCHRNGNDDGVRCEMRDFGNANIWMLYHISKKVRVWIWYSILYSYYTPLNVVNRHRRTALPGLEILRGCLSFSVFYKRALYALNRRGVKPVC